MQPLHSAAALYDEKRGIAIFTRGLHAFEPIREDDQITIALTMLRAVGWIDKEKGIGAAGAQMQGEFKAEFMVMQLGADHDHVQVLRMAQAYNAPLRAYQYDEKPPQSKHSYLQFDNDQIVMTTLKPPLDGDGMILRLLNPNNAEVETSLSAQSLRLVQRLNLAEEMQDGFKVEDSKTTVKLAPHQLVTLRLGF